MTSPHSVALDSNVLALFIVGVFNRKAISSHRRLEAYRAEDFDKLVGLIAPYWNVVTTPQSLAEVSSLLEYDKRTARRTLGILKAMLQGDYASGQLQEELLWSKELVQEDSFMWLGLTDASFVELAKKGIPVITADARLYARTSEFNGACVNFATLALS